MILPQNIIRIVFPQLEQGLLTDLQKLSLNHVGVIILLSMPAEWVGEDEGDQDEVEEGEGVQGEVGEES